MAGLLEQLDKQLEILFQDWNWLTTSIALLLAVYVIYPTFSAKDADTHPFLLHRQANISPVRQPGESAVYRSLNTLHGSPLITGLNVKEAGGGKWAAGKPGDLRDVWRRTAGLSGEDGNPHNDTGKIMTTFGVDQLVQHDFKELSRNIDTLGQYVKQRSVNTVAICLPNSVESLVIVFAAAFYGLSPVFIPHDQPENTLLELLRLANAEIVIASAGTHDWSSFKQQCLQIKEVMLVVPPSSRHMNFAEGSGGPTIWHEIVERSNSQSSVSLPHDIPSTNVPPVSFILVKDDNKSPTLTTYSQRNLVSAIAAQIAALPARHRISTSDTFLAADSFANPAILITTFAALFSNASLAIHSVASDSIDLSLACRSIIPTVIATSSTSAKKLHTTMLSSVTGAAKSWALRGQMVALREGYMPGSTTLGRFISPVSAAAALGGKVRLMYVYERLGSQTSISSGTLSQLRAFTGARIIYGLVAPQVAGTVAQTGLFDYRVRSEGGGRSAHFGAPAGCLEIKLVDTAQHRNGDDGVRGEVVVSGPAVVGGSANLGALMTFGEDGTLAYL